MFTPLSKIVPKTFAKLGLTRQARAALVCERYRKAALEILPQKLLTHSWPKFLRNATLMIGVTHPAYAQEILQHKEAILEFLNKNSPLKTGVKDIRTKVEAHMERMMEHPPR